jgi:hypothetical protein
VRCAAIPRLVVAVIARFTRFGALVAAAASTVNLPSVKPRETEFSTCFGDVARRDAKSAVFSSEMANFPN